MTDYKYSGECLKIDTGLCLMCGEKFLILSLKYDDVWNFYKQLPCRCNGIIEAKGDL